MNLLKKYARLSALIVAAAGLFSACSSDDDYTPGPQAEGAQVYFSNESATTYAIGPDDASVAIDVLRSAKEEEIEVPILATIADEYAGLFNVPETVSFAAGESKTSLVITFDRSRLTDGASYAIALAVDDPTMTTPYGAAVLNLNLTVPEPWRSLGTGLFSDAFLFEKTYKLEIQQHELQPTRFRVVNPYAGGLIEEEYYEKPEETANAAEYLEFILMRPGNKLNDVTITKEGLVYFEPVNTGFFNTSNDYNQFVYLYHPSAFTSMQTEDSWSFNKVLQWQDDAKTLPAVVQLAPFYYMEGLGGWNKSAEDGWVTIVFPGVELTDYSVEVAYTGRFTDTKDNSFAVAEVTGGADVEYIEVGMGAGEDANAILAAMQAGEIEPVRIEGNAGSAKLPVAEDGTYTIVAISYGAGEAKEAAAVTFNFYVGSAPEIPVLEKDYTIDDLYTVSKEELLKPWFMWARDFYDKEGNKARQPLSVVTFSENTVDDGDDLDAIDVKGLSLGYVEEDAVVWEYYSGVFYSLGWSAPIGIWDNYYIGMLITDMTTGKLYNPSNYMLVGGIVDEGYMALASNNKNYHLDGIALHAFKDAAMEESAGNAEIYYDIMFEDPAVSSLTPAAAAAPKALKKGAQLKSLAGSLSVRDNFVETPRGYVHSKIDALRARQKEARMEAAPADAIVKAFRGSVQGLHETAPRLGLPVSATEVAAN